MSSLTIESDVEKNIEFQKKSWTVQRAAWVILAVFLVASILGIFGGIGPLASASVGERGSPIRLDYKRFAQYFEPTQFRIQVTPASGSDTVRVWIDRVYLDQVMIQWITPEPESQDVSPDRITFTFSLSDASEPVHITFEVRHTRAGFLSSAMGLESGETLEFSQLVYP